MQIIQSFISNAKYPISDAYDRYFLRPLSLNNSLCAFVFTFCLFFSDGVELCLFSFPEETQTPSLERGDAKKRSVSVFAPALFLCFLCQIFWVFVAYLSPVLMFPLLDFCDLT